METSQELFDAFREDIVDTARPYLWTDDEVTRYADAAYRMFVRLTGGISDFTSEATVVALTTGEDIVDLHPSILRIMECQRSSDEAVVKVINNTDLPVIFNEPDYKMLQPLSRKNTPGTIKFLIHGVQKHKGKVIQIPQQDEELWLSIYRLPLVHIVDGSHPLDEVDEDHHIYLLDWMKHLAYKKQDTETFNKSKSDEMEASFTAYCARCKAEWERYKHKTRVVTYGGL